MCTVHSHACLSISHQIWCFPWVTMIVSVKTVKTQYTIWNTTTSTGLTDYTIQSEEAQETLTCLYPHTPLNNCMGLYTVSHSTIQWILPSVSYHTRTSVSQACTNNSTNANQWQTIGIDCAWYSQGLRCSLGHCAFNHTKSVKHELDLSNYRIQKNVHSIKRHASEK